MAKAYSFKENKTTTKKIIGFYDLNTHTIDVDGVKMDILKELEIFEGAPIELVVRVKEETDLTEEM